MYSFRLDLTALAIIASLTLSASWASAQSQSDLRRENQRLRTEVSDLERELEAAQQRIDELEAEIRRLQEAFDAGGQLPGRPGAPEDPEPVTIDETVATASPRALFRELETRYRETFADLPVGAHEEDPERIVYMRALRHWVAKVNREFHQPIEWFVTLESDARPRGRGFLVRVQAVDPKTDYKLGEPFPVFLPRTLAMHLQQRDYDWEGVLVMGGVLVPQVQIDPERVDEGLFNSPPFIGTFVEFEIAAEARTLLPKERVLEEEEDDQEEDDDGQEADVDRNE